MNGRQILSYLFAFGIFITSMVASPLVADNYTPAKWAAVYTLAALCGITLFFGQIPAISLPKNIRLSVGLLITTQLIAMVFNPSPIYASIFLDWFAFAILSIASYTCLQNQRMADVVALAMVFSGICVATYGFLQLFGFEPFPQLTHSPIPSATFGFQNMTAEMIGLTLIFAIYLTSKSPTSKFLWLAVIFFAAYLFILSCRACILALLISAIVWLFFHERKTMFSHFLKLALTLAMAFALAQGLTRLIENNAIEQFIGITSSASYIAEAKELAKFKAINANTRLIRWANTLWMIKENFFGVGPGRFEFGYIPYDHRYALDPESTKAMVVKSPHNGFLGFAAESGVLALCTLLALLVFLVVHIYRARLGLAAALLTFFLVDGFFAFPMDNAFPFLIAAFLAGHLLQSFEPIGEQISRGWLWILGYMTLFVVYMGTYFIHSKMLEFHRRPTASALHDACRHDPRNWRLCLRAADRDVIEGRLERAESTLCFIQSCYPNHFPAAERLRSLVVRR